MLPKQLWMFICGFKIYKLWYTRDMTLECTGNGENMKQYIANPLKNLK